MEAQIKAAIQSSLKEIEEVQRKFDEMVDATAGHWPEQTAAVRERTRETLAKIRTKLDESMRQAGEEAQDAQVQAHLGLMEAQDRLEASRQLMDGYLDQWRDRSKTAMDEAQVKAHLATMEAQDFWERRGQHLVEEFRQSSKSMQSLATMAVGELHEQFGRWNAVFTGMAAGAAGATGAAGPAGTAGTAGADAGDSSGAAKRPGSKPG